MLHQITSKSVKQIGDVWFIGNDIQSLVLGPYGPYYILVKFETEFDHSRIRQRAVWPGLTNAVSQF